ncbi:hypothetical protein ACG2LH_00680 [Zhouia sp. PK063]|uniref:hypothetical protein n=1 Tax=Zhouia sp. PK063 TaxID=3373602 RepID=UPI0037AD3EC4
MKKALVYILFLVVGTLFAQESVNQYKYVVVPKKYDFQKRENQYRVNTLVKFLFDKNGFNAHYDDDLPKDLAMNSCLGLKAKVRDESNLFTTKVIIELIDCQNKVVFTTPEVKSKIKDYDEAYEEAIRKAFESITALNYKYEEGSNAMVSNTPNMSANAQSLSGNVPTTVQSNVQKETNTAAAEQAYLENKKKEMSPVKTETAPKAAQPSLKNISGVLYAQKLDNGYQLVNTTPAVVMVLLSTSLDNVYRVKGSNAMVFNKNNKWILETYDAQGDANQKELNIKF